MNKNEHKSINFILGKIIGGGNDGDVYECVYKNKNCAVKIMSHDDDSSREITNTRRLCVEFKTIVPEIYDIFTIDDQDYIVMEKCSMNCQQALDEFSTTGKIEKFASLNSFREELYKLIIVTLPNLKILHIDGSLTNYTITTNGKIVMIDYNSLLFDHPIEKCLDWYKTIHKDLLM